MDFRHTTQFIHDSEEGALQVSGENWEWNAISCCIASGPRECCVSLGDDGHINLIGSGIDVAEQIIEPQDRSGDLREVRAIEGIPYVVGSNRQCFRRTKPGVWERFDEGLPPGGSDLPGLESIHGFSANELYAVGWNGEIWERSERTKGKWRTAGQPTNLAFFRVLCAGDGNVYIAGQGGILFKGRQSTWACIEHETTTEDITDIEWYADKLWLSTSRFLYTLEPNGKLKLVGWDDDIPDTCNHLSTADGVLWSIGSKDVMQFDGKAWTRIL
jgi:hypothetical protein